MSTSQRDNGLRAEREIVDRHKAINVHAERYPLSGASHFAAPVTMSICIRSAAMPARNTAGRHSRRLRRGPARQPLSRSCRQCVISRLKFGYKEESMSEVDGATLIARSLKQQGMDHLFGVVGFPVTPIAAAAQKEGVAYIGMRNEQAASYAAQAYGYLTGRPGACIVVTGPGVVHGLAGLANAQQNCWPMILFGGASETYRGGMGAFQEERQVLIASPFCKFA